MHAHTHARTHKHTNTNLQLLQVTIIVQNISNCFIVNKQLFYQCIYGHTVDLKVGSLYTCVRWLITFNEFLGLLLNVSILQLLLP